MDFSESRSSMLLLILNLLIVTSIFLLDIFVPIGISIGITYVIPILITLWINRPFLTVSIGILSSILIGVGFFMSPTPEIPNIFIISVFNRLLSFAGVWIAVIFIIWYKKKITASLSLENRFHALFRHAAEGILLVNGRGEIVDINPRCEKLFNYEGKELIGQQLEVLLPQEIRGRHINFRKEYNKVPHPRSMGRGMDLNGLRKDGTQFPVEISLSYFRHQNEFFVMAFIIDITERKLIEKALSEERNFVTAILDTIGALIVVLDTEGKVIRFNKTCEILTGFKSDEMIGRNFWNILLPEEEEDTVKEVFRHIKKGSENMIPTKFENHWITKSGETLLINWSNTMIINEKNQPEYIIATGIDITEQKKLERSLLTAIVEGQEQERIRLSRELHDGLAPLLSSVKNNLESIEPGIGGLEQKKMEYFQNSLSLLNESMNEIRTMAKALMPRILEDFGLKTALKDLCSKIDSTTLQVNFYTNVEPKRRFTKSIEIAMYRIGQELMNNILKYANATVVSVQLIAHEDSIVLMVEDNGKGYDINAVKNSDRTGLGLKNIESRVKSLDGTFTVDSHIEKGTVSTVEIPLFD